MNLKRIDIKNDLDKLILKEPSFLDRPGLFLQSSAWAEILQDESLAVQAFTYCQKEAPRALILASQKKIALLGNYYYSPKGPLFKEDASKEEVVAFFQTLSDLLKKEKTIFLRFEPDSLLLEKMQKDLGLAGSLVKVGNVQPAQTRCLNLDKSEEDLLADMHPKTRYNIRLAQKKGLTVREGGLDDFDDFWRLMSATSQRDKFRLHSPNHYRRLLTNNDFIKLLLVEYQGEVLAVGLFSFFAGLATYMHGASSNSNRQLMAPYLLQWRAISMARERSCCLYDFYGIDDQRWPGVTRFKAGFGGYILSFPGTYDLILDNRRYRLYGVLKKIKKLLP